MLKHGGGIRAAAQQQGIDPEQWLDLSTGINPHAYPVAQIKPQQWQRLPETHDGLEAAAQHYYGVDNLLATAGSQALIQALPELLFAAQQRSTITIGILTPSYAEHGHRWQTAGYHIRRISHDQLHNPAPNLLHGLSALVIINPNNPNGTLLNSALLLKLHRQLQQQNGYLIVDEAFMDCTPEQSLIAQSQQQGLIVLRSLGKFFGLAGIRVGFLCAHPTLLNTVQEHLGPWSISGPSRVAAQQALADFAWQEQMRRQLPQESQRLHDLLNQHGFANSGTALFRYFQHPKAQQLHQKLAQQAILSRYFEQPKALRLGLPADEAQWQRLQQTLQTLSNSQPHHANSTQPPEQNKTNVAKTLMVQGTTSDAGKSILVTGLCRLMKRWGYAVAPFKPQNMALNSCVSVDGGEIGRAQAVQAYACDLEPHSHMNPVLLKPNSDRGAQVIIHGQAIGNMQASEYQKYKGQARRAVLTSHQYLQDNFDIVMVEGAGSPAEINLRRSDIANMGFAEAVDCPVILVADIDRGGVFAHLVGTLDLLSPSERQRVKGFVINRFRGDITLLKPGLDWLEQKTGKPVLGVLPYLSNFYLDAEDSVDQRQTELVAEPLKVVVPRLPRISNHNDFDPLRQHPQVDLQFVPIEQPLPACDLLILPGSKSVRSDLAALQKHRWPEQIQRHLRYSGKLLGICGGLQMLGEQIHDPLAIEGAAGSRAALGVLQFETTLQAQKTLRQVQGVMSLENAEIKGYEIHAGHSAGLALQRPFAQLDNGQHDGACSEDGQIIGTYLHGLFESATARDALLHWAGAEKLQQRPDHQQNRMEQIERLTDAIEQHLDLELLRSLIV